MKNNNNSTVIKTPSKPCLHSILTSQMSWVLSSFQNQQLQKSNRMVKHHTKPPNQLRQLTSITIYSNYLFFTFRKIAFCYMSLIFEITSVRRIIIKDRHEEGGNLCIKLFTNQ